MSLKDKLVDIFNAGPDDWEGRLQPSITFISPDNNEFEAKWVGDNRTVSKKLGIFLYPKVRGNIVQDLDLNSTRYSIPIFFDGKDCDKNAAAFFQACGERGQWSVNHPMHGFLGLQLISAKENDEPISSGGVILVETEWIEPIDESTLLTAAEMANLVSSSVDDLNVSAAQQFADNLQSQTEALKQGIESFTNGIQNLTDFFLGPLYTAVDALDNAINAIQNGIQDTLNATVLDALSLAGQIQQLIQLPLLSTTDVSARLEAYNNLADGVIDELPSTLGGLADTARLIARNNALIGEIALTAAVGAVAQVGVTGLSATAAGLPPTTAAGLTPTTAAGLAPSSLAPTTTTQIITEFGVVGETPLETRLQVIEAAQDIAETFDKVTDALDLAQEQFENEDIDRQYFSQSEAYADAAQVTYQSIQYLLLSSFDLKIERSIVLKEPKTPIEITVDEYGTLRENDANLDLLIRSNNLSGDEIYILPAGREIVIYA